MEPFKPNDLTLDEIDDLEDWQLLLAACHFGPTMGECRTHDYGYTRAEDGTLFCGDVALTGDIEERQPMAALRKYALPRPPPWRVLARTVIREFLADDE